MNFGLYWFYRLRVFFSDGRGPRLLLGLLRLTSVADYVALEQGLHGVIRDSTNVP